MAQVGEDEKPAAALPVLDEMQLQALKLQQAALMQLQKLQPSLALGTAKAGMTDPSLLLSRALFSRSSMTPATMTVTVGDGSQMTESQVNTSQAGGDGGDGQASGDRPFVCQVRNDYVLSRCPQAWSHAQLGK